MNAYIEIAAHFGRHLRPRTGNHQRCAARDAMTKRALDRQIGGMARTQIVAIDDYNAVEGRKADPLGELSGTCAFSFGLPSAEPCRQLPIEGIQWSSPSAEGRAITRGGAEKS